MAGTETLERVAKIVDALAPIGRMNKGTPLKAGDWNAVVGAVVELARIAIAREKADVDEPDARYASAGHAHTGEIDASWFDAATRDMLEERLAGNVELRSKLETTRLDLSAVKREVSGTRDHLNGLHLSVDGLFDRDRSREEAVRRLGARVEGFRNLQTGVTGLETRFASINLKLQDALDFRARLRDANGVAIDPAGLVARVKDLEGLRESMKNAAGEVVRMRDFEARLTSVERRALTRENLDAAIGERLRAAGAIASLAEPILEAAGQRVDARFDEAASRIDTANAAAAELDGRVRSQAEAAAAVEARLGAAEDGLGRVSGLPAQVEGIGRRVDAVERGTQHNATALTGLAAMPGRVAAVETRVGALEPLAGRVDALAKTSATTATQAARVEGIDTRLGAIEGVRTDLVAATARLAAAESQLASLRTDLKTLGSRVTIAESAGDDVLRRFGALETSLTGLRKTVTDIELRVPATGSGARTGPTTIARPGTVAVTGAGGVGGLTPTGDVGAGGIR